MLNAFESNGFEDAARRRSLNSQASNVISNFFYLDIKSNCRILKVIDLSFNAQQPIFILSNVKDGSVINHLARFIAPNHITHSANSNFVHVSSKKTIHKLSGIGSCYFLLDHRSVINDSSGISHREILEVCSEIVCWNGVIFPSRPLIENIQF